MQDEEKVVKFLWKLFEILMIVIDIKKKEWKH